MKTRRFVYVIGRPDPEETPIKVGISFDLQQRLTALRNSSPVHLVVHYAFKVPHGSAHGVEAAAHEELRDHHSHGEWFNVSAAAAKAAIEKVAPDVIEADTFQRRCSDDWLVRLGSYYALSINAPMAVECYRGWVRGRKKQAAVATKLVAERYGTSAVVVLNSVVIQHKTLEGMFRTAPDGLRLAAIALAKAINTIAEYCDNPAALAA